MGRARFGVVDRQTEVVQAFNEFMQLRGLSAFGQSNTAMVPSGGGGGGSGQSNDDGDNGGAGDNGGSSGSSRSCPPCRNLNGLFVLGTVSGLSLLAAAIFGR